MSQRMGQSTDYRLPTGALKRFLTHRLAADPGPGLRLARHGQLQSPNNLAS